jgi:hypothetical protein
MNDVGIMPDFWPDREWDDELADLPEPSPPDACGARPCRNGDHYGQCWSPTTAVLKTGPPRPGEPPRCTCTQAAVATLEQTLACPADWYPLPGGGWAHALPAVTP